jgi:hypothetical protein
MRRVMTKLTLWNNTDLDNAERGQIPLERLDLIVDPKSRALRVNPASPDAPRIDAMRAAA